MKIYTMDRLKWEDFEIVDVINEGGFATTYRATVKMTGSLVVLKRLKNVASNPAKGEACLQEAVILYNVVKKDSGFAKLTSCFVQDGHVYLVSEYFDGFKSVKNLVEERSIHRSDGLHVLTPTELSILTVEMVHLLSILHTAKLRHGDIRPDAILVVGTTSTASAWYRLGDFGSSFLDDDTIVTTFQGFNMNFVAPELMRKIEGVDDGQPLTGKADMWSLGATLLSLAVGFTVRDGGSDSVRRFRNNTWNFEDDVLQKLNPTQSSLWKKINPIVQEVIQQCMIVTAQDRVNASDIQADVFYSIVHPLAAVIKQNIPSPVTANLELGGYSTPESHDMVICDQLYQRALNNVTSALQALKKRAYLGSRAAEAFLMVMYLDGQGVVKDVKRAQVMCSRLYSWLVDQQISPAAGKYADYILGKCYHVAGLDMTSMMNLNTMMSMMMSMMLVEKDVERAVALYQRAAEKGYAPAQYCLGYCLEKNQGVDQRDLTHAAQWFTLAAEQGFSPAQHYLGSCYCNDAVNDENNDYDEALAWYRVSAEQGYAPAHTSLGNCFYYGKGVVRDYVEAIGHYQIASELGQDAAAQCQLGFCHLEGHGVDKTDLAQAWHWFNLSAAQEYAEAEYQLGLLCEQGFDASNVTNKNNNVIIMNNINNTINNMDNNAVTMNSINSRNNNNDSWKKKQHYQQAARYFKSAAQKHHKQAQFKLAQCYYHGKGLEQSASAAIIWFQLSAEAGFMPAMYNLGYCYEKGDGVARDTDKAFQLYEQAAQAQFAPAQNALGNCYKSGNVPAVTRQLLLDKLMEEEKGKQSKEIKNNSSNDDTISSETAESMEVKQKLLSKQLRVEELNLMISYYRLAADQGLAAAQYNLGICYYNGLGVPLNYETAVSYFQQAATQGYGPAHNNLGVCYKKGLGVSKNTVEAVRHFRVAAETHHVPAAQYYLAVCYTHNQVPPTDSAMDNNNNNNNNSNDDIDNTGGDNIAKAVYWYAQAAQQGHLQAMFWLATAYATGQGIAPDMNQAFHYYEKAAQMGHSKAQYYLGNCYFHGQGTDKDLYLAEKWYRKAAEAGEEHAIAALQRPSSTALFLGSNNNTNANINNNNIIVLSPVTTSSNNNFSNNNSNNNIINNTINTTGETHDGVLVPDTPPANNLSLLKQTQSFFQFNRLSSFARVNMLFSGDEDNNNNNTSSSPPTTVLDGTNNIQTHKTTTIANKFLTLSSLQERQAQVPGPSSSTSTTTSHLLGHTPPLHITINNNKNNDEVSVSVTADEDTAQHTQDKDNHLLNSFVSFPSDHSLSSTSSVVSSSTSQVQNRSYVTDTLLQDHPNDKVHPATGYAGEGHDSIYPASADLFFQNPSAPTNNNSSNNNNNSSLERRQLATRRSFTKHHSNSSLLSPISNNNTNNANNNTSPPQNTSSSTSSSSINNNNSARNVSILQNRRISINNNNNTNNSSTAQGDAKEEEEEEIVAQGDEVIHSIH